MPKAKAKRGYFRSTEPAARKVVEQITSSRRRARPAPKSRTTKQKKR